MKKKFFLRLLFLTAALCFAAYGLWGEQAQAAQTNAAAKSNILIAYFTFPETDGVDAVAGASRVISNGKLLGNTQLIAQIIQQSVGGELFEIKAAQKYPGEHRPLVNQAAIEKQKTVRPKLAERVKDMNKYDVVFIGFPNWWADMPMPLYTFLTEYDLKGKTVIPFSTHGGSGFSGTINTIAAMQKGATVVTDAFTVSRDDVSGAKEDVKKWLDRLAGKSIFKI